MADPWDPAWVSKPEDPFLWEWWVVGDPDLIVIKTRKKISWFKRFWTTIFLGSKWKKIH